MGTHGWGGNPPATDAEARQRIIDAAASCIDRFGVAKTTLSDVASELGVTRQTVYRHVGALPDIVALVASQGADDFVVQMIAHLDAASSPAEAVTEGFLFCLRTVPTDPRLTLLLELGDPATFARTATSPDTIAYGAQMLKRFPVDWAAGGVHEDDLPGLAEVILRLLISMLSSAEQRPEEDVRAFLQRWLAPALQSP